MEPLCYECIATGKYECSDCHLRLCALHLEPARHDCMGSHSPLKARPEWWLRVHENRTEVM